MYSHLSRFRVSDTSFLYCIVAHLKAGNSGSDENLRSLAANSIMNWVENNAQGENVLLLGDLNLYNSSEPAFQTLVFNSIDSIRFYDPAGKQNGWAGSANAWVHTQSPRTSSQDCGSGGGMDDRFDMILGSKAVKDGLKGITYLPATYATFGNDGDSYNQELTCDGSPLPSSLCGTLKNMSDHLPVIVELELADAVGIEDELAGNEFSIEFLGKHGDLLEWNILSTIERPQHLSVRLRRYDGKGNPP